MSYSTQVLGAPVLRTNDKVREGGLWTRLMNEFARVQQARADRVVRPYLASLDDDRLALLGFSQRDIDVLRSERHPNVIVHL